MIRVLFILEDGRDPNGGISKRFDVVQPGSDSFEITTFIMSRITRDGTMSSSDLTNIISSINSIIIIGISIRKSIGDELVDRFPSPIRRRRIIGMSRPFQS
jgi:hypothetical protein